MAGILLRPLMSAADTSMCAAGQVACVVDEGLPTSEHSWFDGYAWQLSYCERSAFTLHPVAAHICTTCGCWNAVLCYSRLAIGEGAWLDSAGVCSMWAGASQQCTMTCSRESFGASGGWRLLVVGLTQKQTNAADGAAAHVYPAFWGC